MDCNGYTSPHAPRALQGGRGLCEVTAVILHGAVSPEMTGVLTWGCIPCEDRALSERALVSLRAADPYTPKLHPQTPHPES